MNHRALCYILSISCILTSSVYPAERAPSPTEQQSLTMAWTGAGGSFSPATDSRTPLHDAAQWGHSDVVSLLLAVPGVDVNAADTLGHTPLHYAAQRGESDVVSLLLSAPGVDVNAAEKELGYTPLYVAAQWGRSDVVSLLLAVPGVDVNAADKCGDTPLHDAAKRGESDVVSLLLSAGVDVNAADIEGKTALDIATEREREDIVQLLRRELKKRRNELKKIFTTMTNVPADISNLIEQFTI